MKSKKDTPQKKVISRTSLNLVLLMFIFTFGLTAQTLLSFSIANFIQELDQKVHNAEIENSLGQEIILEIHKIESNYFRMASFPNQHMRKILQGEIQESGDEILHILKVLNYGGTYKHNLDLNLPNTDEQFEILYYQPIKIEQFKFAQADITPKLEAINQKLAELHQLLVSIDQNGDLSSAQLNKKLSQLKLSIKFFEPTFHRLKEDANQIFYSNRQYFERLRTEVDTQKSHYKNLQITLTALLFLGGFFAFWTLSRNIHMTAINIEQSRDYSQDILNSQQSIIIVNDGNNIIDASGGFFDFFREYQSINEFMADYDCICDLFVKEEGMVYKFSDRNWIQYLIDNPEQIHKARLRYHDNEHIFQLNAQKSSRYHRYIISMIDITELEQINQDLQREKNRALEATKSKDEFLANMSHEIRTPLNAIIGFIDLLKQQPLDKEGRKYLRTITQSSNTLLNILNDILDLSKIESGGLTLDMTDFSPHNEFSVIADLFKARCQEKHLDFNIHFSDKLPKTIRTDALRLKQIISNLLSNSVKFTDSGKKITLEIDFSNGWLRIAVLDEGIGMTAKEQTKIFDAFTQAETSTTRKYGGTGLGLTISSKLVSMLGGSLKVESELGKGSKFYFSIPVHRPLSSIESKPKIQQPESQNYQGDVLLVEDNKTNQMLMQAILKKFGLNFTLANDGLEAVALVKEQEFNLILMDENMPHLNGIEATKQIRQWEHDNGRTKNTIVALTANAMSGEKERFINAGMDDYLSKPINMTELNRIFSENLETRA